MAVRFKISSSLLPDHALVAAFQCSEGISRPYVVDVYVVVTGGVDVDVDKGPGAKATLTIDSDGEAPVRFAGMIARMELLRAVSTDGKVEHENCLYLVRIVPHLWQLLLTRHSRIWTKKTIPQIIKDVLDAEGVSPVELRIRGAYEPEEHVCQYKESSFNFIQRWMEREGLYYFFEQGDSGETLVITDSKSTATASRSLPIPYHTAGIADVTAGPHLDTFTWRNNATPAAVKLTDYDYGKPALDVVGHASVSKLGVGEQVTYGNRFFTPKQGDALAAIRAEDLLAQARTYHGSGAVLGITSGYFFTLEGHPRQQLNAEYLAVTVEHVGWSHSASSWGKAIPIPYDDSDTYRVEVVAIAAKQQYRHPETALWPRVDGFENAIVDGPAASEYAQLDDQGRYNLKFKFDEGDLRGGKASTWVRKMEPHAGTVEGWHFPERAGTEVVCAFLGGDPDRPIIVGAVPTAIHPNPVTSGNHTKNVIQTGGKNRFEMEDLAGQQRVTISTPHQRTFLHLGAPLSGLSQVFTGDGDVPDHHSAIVTDGNNLIKTMGNQDIYAGANWWVYINGNHVETICGNRDDEVLGYMGQTISGTLDQDVTGAVSNEYHATYQQDVQGIVTQNFKADHNLTIDGTQTVKIGGDQNVNIEGSQTVEIKADLGIHADGAWNHKIEGPKAEWIGGAVQNIFMGLKSELTVGVSIEEMVGVSISLVGALQLEVAPSALNFKISEGKFVSEKAEANAQKAEMEAIHSKFNAVSHKIGGLHHSVHSLTSHVKGLEHNQAGLQSRVDGLSNKVAGLHVRS